MIAFLMPHIHSLRSARKRVFVCPNPVQPCPGNVHSHAWASPFHRPAHIPRVRAALDDQPIVETIPADETTLQEEDGALDSEGGRAEVLKPDPRLATSLVFLGGFCIYQESGWLVIGYPLLLLGLALFLQTSRVRFVFGPTKLNVAVRKGGKLDFIRGWAYENISNWELYPSPAFPVLAYFREKESYAGRGSIHFFPVLCNGEQLHSLLQARIPRE